MTDSGNHTKMEMPVDKVRKVLKIAVEPISLETPIGEEEDNHIGDFLEDKTQSSLRIRWYQVALKNKPSKHLLLLHLEKKKYFVGDLVLVSVLTT